MYRHESTVERALDSLLGSDCSRMELIVCDDASPDRSYEVAAAWFARHAHRFAGALLLRNPCNLGITGNLNRLVGEAHGEFLTLLASDDELTPGAIDAQRSHLRRQLDSDFVFSNVELIDADSQVLKPRVVGRRRAQLLRHPAVRMIDLVCNWGLPWPRLFARRAAFMRFGPYIDDHSIEDRWSTLKIAQTRRFDYLDAVVHRYRVRQRGGTGGMEQATVLSDMFDVERRLIPETTGLLRLLLRVRDRSFPRPGRPHLDRPLWWLLRRVIDSTHRLIVGP